MKVSYWRFEMDRPLTVVHWTLIFVQSAIDYPSAASFAKQFDYFNQPRASIQWIYYSAMLWLIENESFMSKD